MRQGSESHVQSPPLVNLNEFSTGRIGHIGQPAVDIARIGRPMSIRCRFCTKPLWTGLSGLQMQLIKTALHTHTIRAKAVSDGGSPVLGSPADP